ncbi:MAG: DNA polymerase III subunit delta [Eggerthellaceae bacterium]|nr:DNA polymerase III subunit delta [Eggerthellaceae bacterium]
MKPLILPIYVLVGSDALKRKQVLERMRVRLEKEENLSFNEESFDGATDSIEALISACQIFPLGFDRRLVVLKNLDALKKDALELLVEYANNPNDSTILFLIADSLPKNTRLYKALHALDEKTIIDCSLKKAHEMPQVIAKMAQVYGLKINFEAARYFVDYVGVDTVRIHEELQKLQHAHIPDNNITRSIIDTYIAKTHAPKVWDLQDACAQRDTALCIKLYHEMSQSTSVHALLTGCVTRIRQLIICKTLQTRPERQTLAQYLSVPAWKVKNHPQWASRWTREQLRSALTSARRALMLAKSGSDTHTIFIEWLLSATR